MDDEQPAYSTSGPDVRRPVEELLLLAIIDAHPASGKGVSGANALAQRERRLKDAMNALFGEATSLKGEQKKDTRTALRWMGAERHRDLGIKTLKEFHPSSERLKAHKERSITELARQAAKLFFANQGDTVTQSLRKQFSQEEEYWIEIAQTHDDVHETLENQILTKVSDLLEKAGIRINPTWQSST